MIRTVLRISWLNLQRDRLALVLTFVLPLAFFSIFAWVFGAIEHEGLQRVKVALVVADDHVFSRELAAALGDEPTLDMVAGTLAPLAIGRQATPAVGDEGSGEHAARALVGSGAVAVAVVLPEGLGRSLGDPEGGPAIRLLVDRANPVAARLVTGVVQGAAMRVGYAMFGNAMGPGQLAVAPDRDPVRFEQIDVLGGGDKHPSTAFFAAGIGVLFLLFAVAGRSAILVEERESGVLERMLASRLRLGELLLGRWIFLTLVGASQVCLMFGWGALAFGIDLWHARVLAGFGVMTAATAAAAAGFGLLLGSTCRTRAQLNGVAAVVILIMSALGGSMFPSFLMPERLQQIGLATFNAWALRGYQKVFWYDSTVLQLWPQVAVLVGMCVLFVAAAHVAARRWRVV